MSTLRQAGRALSVGFGLAVVAAFAMVGGCASTGAADAPGEASAVSEAPTGEVAQAFLIDCTNAGGTVAGALSVTLTSQGAYCYRTSVIQSGGAAPPPPPPGLPSCWQIAKQLGCFGF